MNRKKAITIISTELKGQYPIVAANGFISRDLFEVNDKASNFYMIGSMGLASSIGLGVALKTKKTKVIVFDGDGNILMNLGSLTTIGFLRPKNLIHVIFDNGSHESTGAQPTSTKTIRIQKIASSVNYSVVTADSEKNLLPRLKIALKKTGPVLFLVKIKTSKERSKRVDIEPKHIKSRFTKSLAIQ